MIPRGSHAPAADTASSPRGRRFKAGVLLSSPPVLCLLLTALTVAVFWRVGRCDFFVSDDGAYVTMNPHVRQGLSLKGVAWAFTTTAAANWHPVTWLSHMLDTQIFGLGPLGPHEMNLALHCINVILLFLFLWKSTTRLWRSAFVASVFALHPLRVESVAWVSERKDVLSTLFWLLTLSAYAAYARSLKGDAQRAVEMASSKAGASASVAATLGSGKLAPQPSEAMHRTTWAWFSVALLCFAMGLMSKPMLVTLPFVLLLLDYWPLGRLEGPESRTASGAPAHRIRHSNLRTSSLSLLVVEKLPFFALSIASCVATFLAQNHGGAMLESSQANYLPLTLRIENAFVSYARYLGKFFWPARLAFPYPHPGQWPAAWVLLGIAIVAGFSIAAFCLRRRRPFLLVGWLWYLGTLIPVIGLIQVGSASMADRYTYVPMIGIAIALAWWAGDAVDRWNLLKPLAWPLAAIVLAACSILTVKQLGFWRDSVPLLRHSVAVTRNNGAAHDLLGVALIAQGKAAEAAGEFSMALRIFPNDAAALHNLASCDLQQGRAKEAITNFERAVRLAPNRALTWNLLGRAFDQQAQFRDALRCYKTALKLNPEDAEPLRRLGNDFYALKQFPDAIQSYKTWLAIQPDDARVWNNLGSTLAESGRCDEAVACFRSALRGKPDFADAHDNLGNALLLLGKNAEAEQEFAEAVRIAPANPQARFHWGIALARSGRRAEAAAQFKEALRLKPDYPDAKRELSALEPSAKE